MDRIYQRDAVQAAYSITKDEQLKLILEQEERDVKVCEANVNYLKMQQIKE